MLLVGLPLAADAYARDNLFPLSGRGGRGGEGGASVGRAGGRGEDGRTEDVVVR